MMSRGRGSVDSAALAATVIPFLDEPTATDGN
jgi:hypothetical protein